jgi:hypothetical protein
MLGIEPTALHMPLSQTFRCQTMNLLAIFSLFHVAEVMKQTKDGYSEKTSFLSFCLPSGRWPGLLPELGEN